MEKLIKFDIESIEKLMNEDKKENKGKVESMKDPALFYINQEIKDHKKQQKELEKLLEDCANE